MMRFVQACSPPSVLVLQAGKGSSPLSSALMSRLPPPAKPRMKVAGSICCDGTRIRSFGLTASQRHAHDISGEADPRISDLGREIADDYAKVKTSYSAPKHPVVLAHGLLGFSTLHPAGRWLPPIQYWHGIRAALEARGVTVITPAVPASATIAIRAAKLAADIEEAVGPDRPVNVIAHSMGGLDARLMASPVFVEALSRSSSHRQPPPRVASLVTVATPHHGSPFASRVIETLGPARLETARRALAAATGWADTGAFAQLTPGHMRDVFNPATPDHPDVRYFSFGAMTNGRPPLLSPFRTSHAVIEAAEGPNDGLVSVASSRWGEYRGTLVGVSHLDLINWSNRIGWAVRKWLGQEKKFNAIAFYLDIADMLSKEGL